MSWFSKSIKSARRHIVGPIKKASDLGYNLVGATSPGQRQQATDLSNEAAAQALADEKQAEYEEQAAKGLERFRMRRRKGFSSTVLTGGPTSLGGPDYGKSLLGE